MPAVPGFSKVPSTADGGSTSCRCPRCSTRWRRRRHGTQASTWSACLARQRTHGRSYDAPALCGPSCSPVAALAHGAHVVRSFRQPELKSELDRVSFSIRCVEIFCMQGVGDELWIQVCRFYCECLRKCRGVVRSRCSEYSPLFVSFARASFPGSAAAHRSRVAPIQTTDAGVRVSDADFCCDGCRSCRLQPTECTHCRVEGVPPADPIDYASTVCPRRRALRVPRKICRNFCLSPPFAY